MEETAPQPVNKTIEKLWLDYLETKNSAAKDKLLVEYSPLVRYTAQRLAVNLPRSVDINDLIGAGVIGLIRAVEKFDPKHEVKFETFASHKIRGAILDELRALDWVPRSIRQKSKALHRMYAKLQGDLGRMPYDEEVAQAMGISIEELNLMMEDVAPTTIISLEETLPDRGTGDKSLKIVDTIEDTDVETNPLYKMGFEETKQILKESISGLPEKEKLVVALYHYEELTLKEIGEVLGISESRASQIHSKAIIKLRSKLVSKINK
jgi:RNA polymerase sigma factor for flagellar operon FliA